ncbi:DUF1302 domain-containing protein [Nitrospirillum pindoramense]|uniref:Uncharacterized protein DUF1302 n=1 Tax=Nitrospirillum amazonense TaxID=28077 RepID=A0A560GZR2_9PROT|nr:DUF1302 family protein [Nitrospirillum amazonense]TWB39545.1 uncharacterized protein DUF1302 [Nitrospirillum amazonense]
MAFRLSVPLRRCCLSAFGLWVSAASGAELYSGGGTDLRWDNTVRYTLANRISPRQDALLTNLNWDDGDRNFAPGLISNRLDLLSALDLGWGEWGLHASAAAWYDTVYQGRTDDADPRAINASSATRGHFARAVRDLQGQHLELREAFARGAITIADMPLSLRVGRQALAWGESLFYDPNSIAAAMAPADYTRPVGGPSAYSSDIYRPVAQAVVTLQPRPDISLSFYDQFEWRPARQAGSGSYFSYMDYMGAGADRLYIDGLRYAARQDDRTPTGGRFGVALHATLDGVDYGLYALRYSATEPQYEVAPDSDNPVPGADGYYRLIYPGGIQLYGASFAAMVGDSTVTGEVSARRNMPLLLPSLTGSGPVTSQYTAFVRGDTLHGQVSLTTALGRSTLWGTSLWDSAEVNAEAVVDGVLNVLGDYDGSQWQHPATKVRVLFEPHYFQVLPNLDLTLPLGGGYNVTGHSLSYYAQNAGAGDVTVGIGATYRSVWKASLTLTHYIGAASRQLLADRDFVALGLERTF